MRNIISYQGNANQNHRYHFTSTRMEELGPLNTTGKNIKWYVTLKKSGIKSLVKHKITI